MMNLRTSHCATAFVAASTLLGLAACSRFLEVRVFNASGESMRVCSDVPSMQCLDLAADATPGLLQWRQGVFTVESGGCKRTYAAPLVESIDDYRASKTAPVDAVVARDYKLFLVRNGQSPEAASEASQPTGFPVVPVAQGSGCK